MDICARYGVNSVAIKQSGRVNVSLRADQTVKQGDILLIIGADSDIDRFKSQMLDE